mmetsp:Transcript_38781/g.69565  ORF Transcript_38781/g.69565 Transcript_38781/m.69565 type:complete len:276 (-) Transcript_38781:122-949(-)
MCVDVHLLPSAAQDKHPLISICLRQLINSCNLADCVAHFFKVVEVVRICARRPHHHDAFVIQPRTQWYVWFSDTLTSVHGFLPVVLRQLGNHSLGVRRRDVLLHGKDQAPGIQAAQLEDVRVEFGRNLREVLRRACISQTKPCQRGFLENFIQRSYFSTSLHFKESRVDRSVSALGHRPSVVAPVGCLPYPKQSVDSSDGGRAHSFVMMPNVKLLQSLLTRVTILRTQPLLTQEFDHVTDQPLVPTIMLACCLCIKFRRIDLTFTDMNNSVVCRM